MSQTGPEGQLTRAERLDRLPYTRKHTKLLVGSGVGWALDAMDVGLISFVMAALAIQWKLDSTTLSVVGSIGFVGMAIGASLGGLLADKVGRRQVFALTLLVYGVATGASALVGSVAVLIVLRFVVGLGLGAELPVASTLVSEYAPRSIRGRLVVALEAFWAVGWILAALIGYLLVPASPDGWRWALVVGVVPTIYAAVVRWGLPESVRFLESKGRVGEAEAAVRSFEESAGTQTPPVEPVETHPSVEPVETHPSVEPVETHPSVEPVETRVSTSSTSGVSTSSTSGVSTSSTSGVSTSSTTDSIWSARYRTRTAALWVVWFCINLSYYGAFIWIPTLLVQRGFPLVRSFEFTLIITLAQLPGYAVAAWLIEKWGRRPTLAVFLAGSAVAAAAFGFATTEMLIIVTGCALSFFNLGAWGALYAVGPELYPTAVRGTGTGAAAAFGRIASIIAPLSVPVMIGAGGMVLVFGVFGVAFLLAAAAALFLPEQAGQALEA